MTEDAPRYGAAVASEARGTTRVQRRAVTAWRRVQSVTEHEPDGRPDAAEYLSLAKRFAALLHGSGLCQSVAFVMSKARNSRSYQQYLEDLAAVMGESGGAEGLARRAREASIGEYLFLTREALASADWLARYAETLLKDKAGAGEDGGEGS